MSSEVDIANLALSHLGDSATVASFSPPEGSAQAEHCARFYPIARDSLLELHTWGFATKRVALALLGSNWPEWAYCYAQPDDMLNSLAVLAPDAADDYSVAPALYCDGVPVTADNYTPQPYSCETDDQGNQVIYTNQVNAVLRYTGRVADSTKFSPLFVVTLSWHLASMLAGPVIKGDAGTAEAEHCEQMMLHWLGKATESDANQRRSTPVHNVGWMSGR